MGGQIGGQMGGPGQTSAGGGQFAPAFGGFMNDQTAQMGFQLGKTAAMAGQEYVEQNVGCIYSRFPPRLLSFYG